ncbi:MAG: hypothetical protein ACLUE1_01050 [Adlercreutzia equolifaciens]
MGCSRPASDGKSMGACAAGPEVLTAEQGVPGGCQGGRRFQAPVPAPPRKPKADGGAGAAPGAGSASSLAQRRPAPETRRHHHERGLCSLTDL